MRAQGQGVRNVTYQSYYQIIPYLYVVAWDGVPCRSWEIDTARRSPSNKIYTSTVFLTAQVTKLLLETGKSSDVCKMICSTTVCLVTRERSQRKRFEKRLKRKILYLLALPGK